MKSWSFDFFSAFYVKVCSVLLSCESFWYEGLDSRESCCLSAKSRNNQPPQQEAAFSVPYSIFATLAKGHEYTYMHTQTCRLDCMHTDTGKHPMTFYAYLYKQKNVQKARIFFGLRTFAVTHFYLDSIFKEGLRHRRQGAEGGAEMQSCSSHTRANPIPCLRTPT